MQGWLRASLGAPAAGRGDGAVSAQRGLPALGALGTERGLADQGQCGVRKPPAGAGQSRPPSRGVTSIQLCAAGETPGLP